MPNGFEQYEIRFSRQLELIYKQTTIEFKSGRRFGGPVRLGGDWTMGLLAMCLFQVDLDRHAVITFDYTCTPPALVFDVAALEEVLRGLSDLQPATRAVMYAELEAQVYLARLLEKYPLFADKG
ncbi:MAG: hypothetical protein KF821_09130 [Anaerolineales bacterium]|nr:hypothetical protein [Anaerolineales bacterium]